jgi:hypothetical protein
MFEHPDIARAPIELTLGVCSCQHSYMRHTWTDTTHEKIQELHRTHEPWAMLAEALRVLEIVGACERGLAEQFGRFKG